MKILNSNNVAILYGEKRISYKELLSNVVKYSKFCNIKPKERAAIFGNNSPEWIYSLLAVWKEEAVAVPLDNTANKSDILIYLDEIKPTLLLTSKKYEDIIAAAIEQLNFTIKVVLFEDIESAPCQLFDEEYMDFGKNKEQMSTIMFTSGTSGKSLAVMLSKGNFFSVIEGVQANKNYISGDVTLIILPFYHAFPLMSMLAALFINITQVIPENLSPEELIRLMNEHKVTILAAVPLFYNAVHKKLMQKIKSSFLTKMLFNISKMIQSDNFSKLVFKKVADNFGGNIRCMVSGGAALNINVERDLRALGLNIKSGYGMTEAASLITSPIVSDKRLGSVGLPTNCQIKIVDNEVIVKGGNVMLGYYDKSEITEAVIKDGWLHTGDYGNIDKDGFLYITGRKKDLIVLDNGKKIWPEELENELLKISPLIKELAVIEDCGKLAVVISIDPNDIEEKGAEDIKRQLEMLIIKNYNNKQPSYRRINKIKIISGAFPRTRILKLKRHTISELLKKNLILNEEKGEILQPDYEELKAIQEYIFNNFGICATADSNIELDLGLDSIQMLDLLFFIKERFGINITAEKMITESNLGDFALYVHNERTRSIKDDFSSNLATVMRVGSDDLRDLPKNNHLIKFLTRYLIKLAQVILGVKLEVKGLENIPNRNVIIIANHLSALDAPLLAMALPSHIAYNSYFVAKEKHMKGWIRGYLSEKVAIITLKAKNELAADLQKMTKVLLNDKNIIIFPEGTRSKNGELNQFKKTFAILAKELNIAILPAAIKGTGVLLPTGKIIPKSGNVHITFLKPIYPEHKKDYDDILKSSFDAIDNELSK